MVQGFSKQLKAILQENGWSLLRQGKGDHEVWAKAGMKSVVVDNRILSRHTANAVIKQAGLKMKF